MSYQYRNPRLLPDGRVDVEVLFAAPPHLAALGWNGYTADANDPDPTSIGRELHATAMADPQLSREALGIGAQLARLDVDARIRRDALLAASDWTQLPDVPAATRAAWATYRQALRDVPQQRRYPQHVTWPVGPGKE